MRAGMLAGELGAQFGSWFYHWCLKENELEIQSEYSLLRRIRNSAALVFIERMQRRTKAEQYEIGKSMVGRFHRTAVEVERGNISQRHSGSEAFLTEISSALAIKRIEGSIPDANTVNTPVLRTEIRNALSPLLGRPISIGAGAWRYTNVIGELRLETDVDFGGRRPLGYLHSIAAGNTLLHRWISLLQWHGISSYTAWNSVPHGEEREAAMVLSQACERFVTALNEYSFR